MSAVITVAVLAVLGNMPAAVDVEPLLKTLCAVGPKAAGTREAARAWEELVRADAAQLPTMLAALDDADPLAANWVRTAVDAVAERAQRRRETLPADALERFVLDRRHAPRARRLAYEWLVRADRSAPERLIGRMLDDPSLEMRRDAVARLIAQANESAKRDETQQAAVQYRSAFAAARDLDQIRLLADRLRKLGQTVDLLRHFGFLVRWKMIGPFDNTGEKGYDVVYPPEREFDARKSYEGKHGSVRWIDHVTKDDHGKVDFHEVFGEEKGVIGYAAAEFIASARREVDFRTTSSNAVRLWLNGELIDEHKVYHHGAQTDQYVARGVLEPGRNVILIKVCQNERTESWTRVWSFQLRVCDENGTAILSNDRSSGSNQ